MLGIFKLHNPIQTYAWGSRTAIAELLGRPPSAEPEAELWIGAHPKASSSVEIDGRRHALAELPAALWREILGPDDGESLSFLLKVLAAEQPLSIQAHPDAAQAADGFRREEAAGVPLDARERRYRDPRPKPELIVARTPFVALHGFRAPEEIRRLLAPLDLDASAWPGAEALDGRVADPGEALRRFTSAFLLMSPDRAAVLMQRILERSPRLVDIDPAYAWIPRLAEAFPGDRGALAPLFLHLLELAPGEALATGPGIFHAYLGGVGIELMGNSDNVLRGGLTQKLIDPEELLRTLRFAPQPPRLLSSRRVGGGELFETPEGLRLTELVLDPGIRLDGGGGAVEILLVVEGEGILAPRGGEERSFTRGESFLVPAGQGYAISGRGLLFRAARRSGRASAVVG